MRHRTPAHVATQREGPTTRRDDDFMRRSAAATLSDLELLVYPELIFGLVLANIMSPRIWRWREDPWFSKLDRLTQQQRILRLKQYIMDRYAFNLDLLTWGLTTTDREANRFQHRLSRDDLCQLSPFFGCTGDSVYFDIDIRGTFGLERYPDNVIPYWKTETVEAMDAFRHRREDQRGAGECVSLAALYAAALFIVCQVPLERIFIIVTPLHCQVFVAIGEGVLTNNRRIITKPMWFNGSDVTSHARRSLENERVVIVSHVSGVADLNYGNTIDAQAYRTFKNCLTSYLKTPLAGQVFVNFLRQHCDLHKGFQVRCSLNGKVGYVGLEWLFEAEKTTSYRVTGPTRKKLLGTVDRQQIHDSPIPDRILLDELEECWKSQPLNTDCKNDRRTLVSQLGGSFGSVDSKIDCSAEDIVAMLCQFCETIPQLPCYVQCQLRCSKQLCLDTKMSRKEVTLYLQGMQREHEHADAAIQCYRDLNLIDAEPFFTAAIERNPVSVEGARERFGAWRDGCPPPQLIQFLEAMPEESIYEETGRLAQPDEVWNFNRGDGMEKGLLLTNIARHQNPGSDIFLIVNSDYVMVQSDSATHRFTSHKSIPQQTWYASGKAGQ